MRGGGGFISLARANLITRHCILYWLEGVGMELVFGCSA